MAKCKWCKITVVRNASLLTLFFGARTLGLISPKFYVQLMGLKFLNPFYIWQIAKGAKFKCKRNNCIDYDWC